MKIGNKFTNEELEKLLKQQDSLNSEYTSIRWKEEVPLSSFITAMDTEIQEYLESSPRVGDNVLKYDNGWKWWRKNLQNDEQNQIVEVIDVLHFMMSILLKQYDISSILEENEKTELEYFNEEYIIHNIMKLKSKFIHDTLGSINWIDTDIKLMYSIIGYMLKGCDRSFQDVYNGYFLKNELNLTRIKGGYMEGEYQKIDMNGNEDNRNLDL